MVRILLSETDLHLSSGKQFSVDLKSCIAGERNAANVGFRIDGLVLAILSPTSAFEPKRRFMKTRTSAFHEKNPWAPR